MGIIIQILTGADVNTELHQLRKSGDTTPTLYKSRLILDNTHQAARIRVVKLSTTDNTHGQTNIT